MINLYKRQILILMVLFFSSLGLNAQIRGEIKDSQTKEAAMFTNIMLLNPSDSSLVAGATANEKGKFTIRKIKDGNYILKVSFIGYKTLSKNIEVKGKTDLGTLYLEPSPETLSEVEIVAERPLFSMEGEKTVYSVEDDPAIQTGTTTDALQNAPGVQVDAEGNITLQGTSCVEVWLNDKPSKIQADGLKTFLENLPANALKKIEVITHPSAKYANTSGCGVINIVTNTKIKKNHFISFGSGINSRLDVSPHISYVWANEKLSIGIYSSLNIRNSSTSSSGYATSFTDNAQGGKDTVYHEETTSENENSSLGGWFSLNIDYDIDSTSTFGVSASIYPNWSNSKAFGTRARRDFLLETDIKDDFIESFYESQTTNDAFSSWGRLNADYRKNFDKNGHRLDVSLNGRMSPNFSTETQVRDYIPANELFENLHKQYKTNRNDYGIDLDARYARPYSKDGEMTYGLNLDLNNDYRTKDVTLFDSTAMSFDIIDSLRSHDKTSNNTTLSGFANWEHRFGKFTITLGARAEAENRDFIAKNTFFADDTNFLFFTFRPSVHLSYRTKSMHNFSFSYSFSTSKPSSDNLSTFRNYQEESYNVGNRNLTNSYSHRIGFNWSKFFMKAGHIGIHCNAHWSNNTISNVTDLTLDPYLGRYISYTIPYNIGSSSSQDVMVMGNLRLGAFANLNVFSTLAHNVYEMDYIDGKHYRQEGWELNGNLRLWAKVSKYLQVFAGGHISTPRISIFSESDNFYTMDLGLSTDLFDKRLQMSLRVQDPFNWNKSENTNFAPYYHSYSSNIRDSRFISFRITLKFGKLELERKQASSSSGEGEQ